VTTEASEVTLDTPMVAALKEEIAGLSDAAAEYMQSRAHWRARARVAEDELRVTLGALELERKAREAVEKDLGEARADLDNAQEEIKTLRAELDATRVVKATLVVDAAVQQANERLSAEVARLKKQPNELLAGCAVELQGVLVGWPQKGDKESKKRLAALRDRCEKWGKGETP